MNARIRTELTQMHAPSAGIVDCEGGGYIPTLDSGGGVRTSDGRRAQVASWEALA